MHAQNGNPGIYIVSGGSGASGEQIVETVLAQFPDSKIEIKIIANVRSPNQVEQVARAAARDGSMIVMTLVDENLNAYMLEQAKTYGVFHVDLMRALLNQIGHMVGSQPVGHPGLYRKLHRTYFDRIEAIEYTMAHDDGQRAIEWSDAEIMLIGVSRVGKTPLSMYLSVLGWKVANMPLIKELQIQKRFFDVDAARVVGLSMQPDMLLSHRRHRQKNLGISGDHAYVNPDAVRREVRHFNNFMQQHGITRIDVTKKPIETSADDIIKLINNRFRL